LFGSVVLVAAFALDSPAGAQSTTAVGSPVGKLWQEPVDIESRDLFYGPGGRDGQPAGRLTFVKEDLSQTKPKFVVRDERGVNWKVKLGIEAQPEVAATRLMWAAGYFVDENYFRSTLAVDGLPQLHRGQQYVVAPGVVRGARVERKQTGKKLGTWHWFENPFVGTREWNGLRILMALLNNWDLSSENNAIRSGEDGVPVYYVSDVGSTLGSADYIVPTRSKASQFARSTFVRHTSDAQVDLRVRKCPVLLAAVFPYYSYCRRLSRVGDDIPREDARWMGELLHRLSVGQIADAFRAAGYTPTQVTRYTDAVLKRIAPLRSL
jgi:hypothetical protein